MLASCFSWKFALGCEKTLKTHKTSLWAETIYRQEEGICFLLKEQQKEEWLKFSHKAWRGFIKDFCLAPEANPSFKRFPLGIKRASKSLTQTFILLSCDEATNGMLSMVHTKQRINAIQELIVLFSQSQSFPDIDLTGHLDQTHNWSCVSPSHNML